MPVGENDVSFTNDHFFTHDHFSRRLSVTSGGAGQTLAWNALGRLQSTIASSVVTQSQYDGDQLVAA